MRHTKRWMAAMMFGNAFTIPAARGDLRNLFFLRFEDSQSDSPTMKLLYTLHVVHPRIWCRGFAVTRGGESCCFVVALAATTKWKWWHQRIDTIGWLMTLSHSLTHSPRPILEEKFMHPHVINLYQISALHLNTKLTYWALVPQDQLWLDWQL